MNSGKLPAYLPKLAPLLLFLGAYATFALVYLRMDREEGLLVQILLVGLIGLMMLAIIWKTGKEDEVRKAILNKAYAAAFWITLLFLMAVSMVDGLGEAFNAYLPFWSVPILSWLISYGIVTLRYR